MPFKIYENNGQIIQFRVERKDSIDPIVLIEDNEVRITLKEKTDQSTKLKPTEQQQEQQQQQQQQQDKQQEKQPETPKKEHQQEQLQNGKVQQADTLLESGEFTAELFQRYEFERGSIPIFENRSGKLLRCFDKQMPKLDLLVRIYYHGYWLRDEKLFISLLRKLATENPHILAVHQTFFTDNKFCIIYEYAHHGSTADYICKYGHASISEEACQIWAKSIYQAMDYLKEMSIAHRSICPKHVMLVAEKGSNDIVAKLWGFRSAIALSSENSHIMQLQPCWMFSCMAMFNFQAPEVFHNDRSSYYDAIDADIWSFAATFLFVFTGQYPYPVLGLKKFSEPELEKAIDETIQFLPLSEDAREFFSNLLVPNPRKRLDLRRIAYLPWLNIHSAELSI